MDLYLAGAEQPTYLKQLANLEVMHIAISFFEWRRRHSNDDLYRHIPSDMEVCITAGIARKESIDFKAFAEDYVEFAERNAEHSIVFDMDAPHCPPKIREWVRVQLGELPNVVVFPMEEETLSELSKDHERLGINARLAKATPTSELRRVQATLWGSNVTNPKVLKGGRFAASTSSAWLSGHRYGELWVFSRGKLLHFPAENLAKAVRIHRGAIEALGVEPDACAANDKKALTALAVISLREMASSLSKRPRDRQEPEIAGTSPGGPISSSVVATGAQPAVPASRTAVEPATERERITLPVISLNEQGNHPKVELAPGSARKCDSCYLDEVCPAFKEGNACAFNIPIEIKTDEQWEAAAQVIIEAQFGRVMFGVFGEQADGGAITPRVGQEMDRFYKQLASVKDLKAPAPGANSGTLAEIFGPTTPPSGDLTPQLGSPDEDEEDTTVSLEDSFGLLGHEEILDAEEVFEDDSTGPIERVGNGHAYEEENAST